MFTVYWKKQEKQKEKIWEICMMMRNRDHPTDARLIVKKIKKKKKIERRTNSNLHIQHAFDIHFSSINVHFCSWYVQSNFHNANVLIRSFYKELICWHWEIHDDNDKQTEINLVFFFYILYFLLCDAVNFSHVTLHVDI